MPGNRHGWTALDISPTAKQFAGVIESKLTQLRQLLESFDSCLVAYSGGVDSVFLAHVAHQVLAGRALAAIADSPSLPRRELQEALAIAAQFGFPVRVVRTQEFANSAYLANPANRCYFCKHELFTELTPLARELDFKVIAYGENASDVGDFRPGAKAAEEFQVRAPLREVGLTKAEIRALSAQLGLPTTDKPQMACLSSRIPHGETVTEAKLHMIETAENLLRDLGFFDVRVRHHEITSPVNPASAQPIISSASPASPPRSALARVEVGVAEMPRLLDPVMAARVAEELKRAGYLYVTLDLQGYRRGGANDLTAKPALA